MRDREAALRMEGTFPSTPGVSIRPAVPDDAAGLAAFGVRTFQEAFGADNRPEDLADYLTRAYGHAQQLAEIQDANVTTLLAEVDGQLAGFAQLRAGSTPACVTGPHPLELQRFYVDSAWHGRGIAQALMTQVVFEAQQRGAATLWLGVWERNARAKAFYIKAGFTDVGSHIFVVGTDPQTDRILVRRLP